MRTTSKVICLLVILLVYLFPHRIEAKWEKSIRPIINLADQGWASESITSPTIIKENGNWIVFFHSYYGLNSYIGKSTSFDMSTWTTSPDPLLNPDFDDETSVETPSIVKTDKYYMWYLSYNRSLVDYKVRLATSNEGINWTKHPQPVLTPSEPWESRGITDPSVIFHDGKYLMFYAGWGNNPWQIGYAESVDGINWTKSPNNPLSLPTRGHVNGPDISFYDNKYHLFYHTGGMYADHIYHVSSTDLVNWQCEEEECTAIESTPGTFDSQMTLAPFVFTDKNKQYMFYGGSDGGATRIGLAINQLVPDKNKLVIIPGLLSSWNEEAMIHRQPKNYDQWILNPIVKDYSGLLTSLDNIGYVRDQDYYVFAYDWRKSIDSIILDFKQFLHDKNLENESLDLVGHSLGGLVARLYLQQNSNANIKHIITLGSPHKGTAQVYKTLAGGEFDESNPQLWLAEKLAIQLYRKGLESDRTIFNQNLPILSDLIALYPYLFDKNANELPYESYQFKNDYLSQYSDLSSTNLVLHSFAGTKGSTLYGYKLGSRTLVDELLNLYPEGHPIERVTHSGDLVVPLESAQTQNHTLFDFDHGQLVSRKDAIAKIFDNLGISYQDNQLIEGKPTVIFPSLLFLVMSPVDLEVEVNGQVFHEKMGILHIPNPPAGSYEVRAKGNSQGAYTILVADLKLNKDIWTRITGDITNSNPQTEIDVYHFNYGDKLKLSENDLWEQLVKDLTNLNQELSNRHFQEALNTIRLARKYWQKGNWLVTKIHLLKVQRELFLVSKNLNQSQLDQLFVINRELETLYNSHPVLLFSKNEISLIKVEFNLVTRLLKQREQYLRFRMKELREPDKIALALKEIYWQRSMVEEVTMKNQWAEAYIYLESCKRLLQLL